MALPLKPAHVRRLRAYYRSAGWPCLDNLELDLLCAGLVERVLPAGRNEEVIRLTEAGILQLGHARVGHQRALDPHQRLVGLVRDSLALQGRLAFCDLSLRAKVDERWHLVRPDVYSIRRSTRADAVWPAIHEIKVRRADLQGELRHPHKRLAYQSLACELTYVFPAGLAQPDEVPADCGVMLLVESRLELVRVATRVPREVSLQEWLELARSTPCPVPESPQLALEDGSHEQAGPVP